MSDTSTYPLRLPKSLKDEVAKLAKSDGTSLNQFIAMAVAEKMSALKTESFFKQRAKQADFKEFDKLMSRKGGEPPREGDEVL